MTQIFIIYYVDGNTRVTMQQIVCSGLALLGTTPVGRIWKTYSGRPDPQPPTIVASSSKKGVWTLDNNESIITTNVHRSKSKSTRSSCRKGATICPGRHPRWQRPPVRDVREAMYLSRDGKRAPTHRQERLNRERRWSTVFEPRSTSGKFK